MYGLRNRDEFDDGSSGKEEREDGDHPGRLNLWSVIGSTIKYYRFTMNYILWDISMANLMMLSCSVPGLKKRDDKGLKNQGDVPFYKDPGIIDITPSQLLGMKSKLGA